MTRAALRLTTRKPPVAFRAMAAAALVLSLGACSTPGPLHLYSVAPNAAAIHDTTLQGADTARDVPGFPAAGDAIVGFAYDPFTDHFFLRLAPGNRMRVVDRPARKIKREQDLEGVPPGSHGDLAVNPRDGHLFVITPGTNRLTELNRFGRRVRELELPHSETAPIAIAFDAAGSQLIVLDADRRTVRRHTRDGALTSTQVLDTPVEPSIGYDAETQALYAPLAGFAGVGVFGPDGRLRGTLPLRAGDAFIDVGPHSFLRVF